MKEIETDQLGTNLAEDISKNQWLNSTLVTNNEIKLKSVSAKTFSNLVFLNSQW